MRVPAHAAVSTTVDVVRREIGHKPVHFTNALLRSIGKRDLDGWLDVVTAGLDDDEATAVRTSHPVWIVQAFRDALGPDGDLAGPARGRQRTAPRHARRPARTVRARRAAGRAGPALALRAHPRRRRPGRDPGRARGSRRRAGRGIPAGRHRPRRRRRGRAGRTMARPVRRPGRQGGPARVRWPRSAGRRSSPTRCSRTGPTWSARPCAGCRTSRSPSTTGARARGRRRRSTASSSTRRAPASARCGVARRRAGGARPTTSTTLVPLQRALLTRALEPRAARRRGRLRHLLAASRRDARRPRGGTRARTSSPCASCGRTRRHRRDVLRRPAAFASLGCGPWASRSPRACWRPTSRTSRPRPRGSPAPTGCTSTSWTTTSSPT